MEKIATPVTLFPNLGKGFHIFDGQDASTAGARVARRYLIPSIQLYITRFVDIGSVTGSSGPVVIQIPLLRLQLHEGLLLILHWKGVLLNGNGEVSSYDIIRMSVLATQFDNKSLNSCT